MYMFKRLFPALRTKQDKLADQKNYEEALALYEQFQYKTHHYDYDVV